VRNVGYSVTLMAMGDCCPTVIADIERMCHD
jgi:hypothetical protein